jgi:hypothetical protein
LDDDCTSTESISPNSDFFQSEKKETKYFSRKCTKAVKNKDDPHGFIERRHHAAGVFQSSFKTLSDNAWGWFVNAEED